MHVDYVIQASLVGFSRAFSATNETAFSTTRESPSPPIWNEYFNGPERLKFWFEMS